jgi:hypothetical protein
METNEIHFFRPQETSDFPQLSLTLNSGKNVRHDDNEEKTR